MQQVFIGSVCVTLQKKEEHKNPLKYIFFLVFRRTIKKKLKVWHFLLILIFFFMNQKFSHMFPFGIGMSGDAEEEYFDNQLLSTL